MTHSFEMPDGSISHDAPQAAAAWMREGKRLRQDIAWILGFAKVMDEGNWRDLALRIERQCRQSSHEQQPPQRHEFDYVNISGPGVDALENRKESGTPNDTEKEVNDILRRRFSDEQSHKAEKG